VKSIKLFTYVDRPSAILKLWLDYYIRTIASIDITILQRNSKNFDISNFIKNNNYRNVNVISIDDQILNPSNFVIDNLLFMKYQKLFLQTHDIVMYADIDEFIVHQNINEILNSNFNTCLVTTGIEIVQNLQNESKFDYTKRINDQRKYMLYSKWYNKPLILNSSINWSSGKHNYNQHNNYVDDLYLIHLGKICLLTYESLCKETLKLYKNNNINKLDLRKNYITHFTDVNHPEQPVIPINNKIKKLLDLIL
jgi:hypothetical protein